MTGDPHAAKYRGEIDAHPEAFTRLFALLNDRANEHPKAERYVKEPPSNSDEFKARALASLDDIAKIGDADEQEQTYREIKEALTATRRAEGRPF